MSAVRDVWADLVEKRLWPLVVLLALALVALPLFALKSSPAVEPAKAPIADAGPAPMVSDPTQIAAARPNGPVGGSRKNPFEQQHLPAAATTTTASAEPGPGTGDTGSGGTPGGGGDSDASSTPAPGSRGRGSKPKGQSDGVTRLRVRFGRSEGRRRVRLLTPGQPLPTGDDPLLVFVDLGKGNRAEFLVSSDAQPEGDGSCKPSKSICAELFMRPGDTQFFDVKRDTGTVQYQLEVLGVVRG